MISGRPVPTFDTSVHNRLGDDGEKSDAIFAALKEAYFVRLAGLALSVEYLERRFWRETAVIKLAVKRPLQREGTDAFVQTVAERDRDMAEA